SKRLPVHSVRRWGGPFSGREGEPIRAAGLPARPLESRRHAHPAHRPEVRRLTSPDGRSASPPRARRPAFPSPGPVPATHTTASHGRARIANVDPARVRREIGAAKIVIVAGFQGATDESHAAGEVTTLGRGGSD